MKDNSPLPARPAVPTAKAFFKPAGANLTAGDGWIDLGEAEIESLFKPGLSLPAGGLKNEGKVSQTFANIADSGPICPKPGLFERLNPEGQFPL